MCSEMPVQMLVKQYSIFRVIPFKLAPFHIVQMGQWAWLQVSMFLYAFPALSLPHP
jgi:hypothetical protein